MVLFDFIFMGFIALGILYFAGALIADNTDLDGNGFYWPISLFKRVTGIEKKEKRRALVKEAERDGYYNMRSRGHLNNPMAGRVSAYMNHKDSEIFDAYIRGGDKMLDEWMEKEVGTSLEDIRRKALAERDTRRLKQIEVMKELRAEILGGSGDRWDKAFKELEKN